MSTSAAEHQRRRRAGVVAALANHTGVALQNWASRRSTASVDALLHQMERDDRRDRETAVLHDGLLR